MSKLIADPTSVEIRAQLSVTDQNICQFIASRTIHPGGPYLFESRKQAAGSPLIERLFRLREITHVLVTGNVLTVVKHPQARWDFLKPAVGRILRGQLLTVGPAIFEPSRTSSTRDRDDEELLTVVQELLDREMNPLLSRHGGKVSIVKLEDRVLHLQMSGGCQGCAAAALTHKHTVEAMVRHAAPEIRSVIDTTDHTAGEQPYYRA